LDPLIVGAVSIGVMLLLGALGVPVAFSMIAVALGGIVLTADLNFALTTLRTLPWNTVNQFGFVVVPMFILMGGFAAAAGITRELFLAANAWLSGVRGGLYMAVTLASAGFAAVSGSTVVNAAVFTRVALPEMLRLGYHPGVSAGCIAAAGTFAALIPPSLVMVVYGLLTGESIGTLLIAGIIPGAFTAAAYIVGIAVMVRVQPDLAPRLVQKLPFKQRLDSLGGTWAMVLLVGIVLGGLYSGAVSPSSAGTIGALGAFAIALARRRLTWGGIQGSLIEAAQLTTVVFLIIIGGLLFSRFLLLSNFVNELTALVQGAGVSPMAFIVAVVLLYLVLGMFMEALSMLVVTLPFLFPIAKSLGIDPIWFGVLVVKLAEVAVISPPVGINLFTVVGASDGAVSTNQIYRGIWPFLLIELVVLSLLIIFPEITLWLPRTMK
jgi:C4-dicarboxylate transporter DctM subunit